jgi:hypothetical protein
MKIRGSKVGLTSVAKHTSNYSRAKNIVQWCQGEVIATLLNTGGTNGGCLCHREYSPDECRIGHHHHQPATQMHRDLSSLRGRTIAQAVSCWLPTAAVRGSSRGLVMWDFVVDKVALGQVFSEHQLLQKLSSSIIWGLYNRPEVAALPRDLDT